MDIRNGLKSFLMLFFSAMSLVLSAQTAQVAKPIIIPEHPTVVDSVFVFLQSSTSGFTTSFGYEIEIVADSIFISHCVKGGVLPSVRNYEDTLNLGLLAEGEYFLRFTVYGSSQSDTCTYEDPIDSSVTFQVTLNTSVSDVKERGGYRVYPNPTHGNQILELNIHQSGGEGVQVTVHDLAGKELAFYSALTASGDGPVRIPLDLSAFPSGYYYVRVKIGGELIIVPTVKN